MIETLFWERGVLDGLGGGSSSDNYLGRFGTSLCWGLVQIFMMLDRNPGRRLQWRVEICARLGRTLPILSIICLSDATALLDEKSLDQICGIEPRPW